MSEKEMQNLLFVCLQLDPFFNVHGVRTGEGRKRTPTVRLV